MRKAWRDISGYQQRKDGYDPEDELFRDRWTITTRMPFVKHPPNPIGKDDQIAFRVAVFLRPIAP